MVALDIKFDDREVSAWFRALSYKHIPFAAARALTWTALDCQKQVRRELPQRFTIRNTFVERGIKIKPANKNALQSEVYVNTQGKFSLGFMTLQETGGIKTPRSRHLAIPTDATRRKGGKRGIIARRNRPAALRNDNKVFKATMPDGTEGIFKRRGSKRLPIDMLYVLKPSAKVDARFDFIRTVERTASERIERNFDLSLADALHT